MKNTELLEVKNVGTVQYLDCLSEMRKYTSERTSRSPDQIWLVEHPPVYTLGLAGSEIHLINPSADIPVIKTDRGGQVTFHGPGQVVAYLLVDLKRRGLFVKKFVSLIEDAVISCLAEFGIVSESRLGAPGVYISSKQLYLTLEKKYVGAKIASIGLKISRGCSYHGVSLNVQMDLEPFSRINPCGFNDLCVTDLKSLGLNVKTQDIGKSLAKNMKFELESNIA